VYLSKYEDKYSPSFVIRFLTRDLQLHVRDIGGNEEGKMGGGETSLIEFVLNCL
jgi:hypothetical protein